MIQPPQLETVHSFAPIASTQAKVLILGSMPGKESLRAQQYYAHPRNAFWPIMGALVGALPSLAYTVRKQILQTAGIAVWDVLQSCIRPGSLDSDIDNASMVPNQFGHFFVEHPSITHVFFNGAKAQACYCKQVLPLLEHLHLNYQRLPSTSPAHAGMTYAAKLAAWEAVLTPC
jgi:TDG/mug DNA glycosylase family protein